VCSVAKDNFNPGPENEYDKIIEQLRNSIDANSSNNNANHGLRINSSKNSQIENKGPYVIYSLTPKAC
jgi:hypothetical protein